MCVTRHQEAREGTDENAGRNPDRRLLRHPPLRAGVHGPPPKDIHTFLVADLVVVRLQGVLTATEQPLVMTFQADKGRELLKQVRFQLAETAAYPTLIQDVTDVKVVSLHLTSTPSPARKSSSSPWPNRPFLQTKRK